MSILEFKLLCEEKRWKTFHYLSENQEGYHCANPLVVNLSFSRMVLYSCPSVVFFDGCCGSLRLNGVKKIEQERSVLGDILTISCWDNKRFTFIAQ